MKIPNIRSSLNQHVRITHLKYLARYGVRNICGYPQVTGDRLYATVGELTRLRELAANNGIRVDCIAPPFLSSSHIDDEKHPAIMLARSPERERDIESLQTLIKNCAAAGIPMIKYNMVCQGAVSEMLANPGPEIFDVIRYFGTRGKIFNVHFRNIRGHRDSFAEVFPDEGDINFVKAIRIYKEIGYSGKLMPDNVPKAAADPGELQSFAYCYGYIRALIQAG